LLGNFVFQGRLFLILNRLLAIVYGTYNSKIFILFSFFLKKLNNRDMGKMENNKDFVQIVEELYLYEHSFLC